MPHPFDNPYAEPDPVVSPADLPSWEEFRDWALSRPDARGMSLDYLHDMYQTNRAYLREHWHERVGSDDLTNMA